MYLIPHPIRNFLLKGTVPWSIPQERQELCPILSLKEKLVALPGHVGMTGLKSEEPITIACQRLPDSPFPKRLSLIPYQRPGTPYRKVDLPGRETGILDKTDDSFEIDSESERTLTEELRKPLYVQ